MTGMMVGQAPPYLSCHKTGLEMEFWKMEIRHTLKRKNIALYSSFSNRCLWTLKYLGRLYKEI